MTTELWCLVANALWGLALVFLEITGKTRVAGPQWNAGNRESEPDFPAWIQRTGRALVNHKENFPVFLTAVVVVALAQKADRVSAIAAVIYVVARALHAVFYIAGVKGIRSGMFAIGLVANLVVFSRLAL